MTDFLLVKNDKIVRWSTIMLMLESSEGEGGPLLPIGLAY